GINSEQIEKIFEPFFTTKEVGKGTGLGLSMCYGAIQSHGGTIEVKSSEGKGTAFHIYLPISQSMESSHITGGFQEAIHGKGETILLVDDDNLLRSSHRDVLQALGYKVLEADNGRHAIKTFKAHKDGIDLVIMDIMMPVMGGAEAADQIRDIRNDIKIIYATGYDKESSLGSQVPLDQNILDKPFTVHQLSVSIRKELDS
ncbi:MAG: response regulator, partial [Mariprofundaceae bacterium]